MNRRVVVGELAELQEVFSTEFQQRAADAITVRGTLIVALTGGSVARGFFPTLTTLSVDWSRIELFWSDERAVPPDHPDSNYALASQLLLIPARVPAARIHRMPAELPDLEQAARRSSDELQSVAGNPPHVDLALLGVGEDGHVASIFQSWPARSAKVDAVMPVYDSPKPPARRLTMSFPVLAGAGIVIVIALGAAKAPVMRAALDQSGDTPIAELLRCAPSSLVLLDRAAALS